jgi:hypothetical protein
MREGAEVLGKIRTGLEEPTGDLRVSVLGQNDKP